MYDAMLYYVRRVIDASHHKLYSYHDGYRSAESVLTHTYTYMYVYDDTSEINTQTTDDSSRIRNRWP